MDIHNGHIKEMSHATAVNISSIMLKKTYNIYPSEGVHSLQTNQTNQVRLVTCTMSPSKKQVKRQRSTAAASCIKTCNTSTSRCQQPKQRKEVINAKLKVICLWISFLLTLISFLTSGCVTDGGAGNFFCACRRTRS